MATVRFSEKLQKDVEDNARAIFKDKIDKARASYPREWADKLYDSVLSQEDQQHMNALPNGVLPTIELLEFDGFYQAPDEKYVDNVGFDVETPMWRLRTTIRIGFNGVKRWVNDMSSLQRGMKEQYRSITVDYTDPRYAWLIDEFKAYTERVHKAEVECEKFVSGVKKVMQTFTTLGPALKEWQPLWDLLPEEAKDRHRKIVHREKKSVAGMNPDIDLTKMTAQVAFNKLTK